MRALGKVFVAVLLTLAFAYVLGVIVQAVVTAEILEAFAAAGLLLFEGGIVSIGLMLLFLLVTDIAGRRRGSGSLFWINVGALVIAVLIGTFAVAAVGLFVGALSVGAAGPSALGSLVVGVEIFVGGVIALALTHFAIFKPRATEFEP